MADCSDKRLRRKSCRAVLIAAQESPAELRLYCPGVARTRFVIALSHYHARTPGLDDRRARHIFDGLVTIAGKKAAFDLSRR